MPLETRWFVKAGLVWLCATFALGAALLGAKAVGYQPPFDLSVVHAHAGFVGFLVNLVIGIALWFLPVNREAFKENRGRYPVAAVRWIFVLLNAGLIVRIIVEPIVDATGISPVTTSALLMSSVAQLAAIVLFAAIAWSRVRQV